MVGSVDKILSAIFLVFLTVVTVVWWALLTFAAAAVAGDFIAGAFSVFAIFSVALGYCLIRASDFRD